jgi:hypothetical protein
MVKEIQLTQGKVALVDDEDFEELNKYKWRTMKIKEIFYAVTGGKKRFTMHRLLLSFPQKPYECDHIDRNGLNNQRLNLRICTRSSNLINRGKFKTKNGVCCSSKYRGVSKRDRYYSGYKSDKWASQIVYNKKTIHLGNFNNQIEAAKAYDKKALELYGEFAQLNFPDMK